VGRLSLLRLTVPVLVQATSHPARGIAWRPCASSLPGRGGAGRAIGAATATELTRAGHEVVATARNVTLLDELDVALRLALDVTDDASVAAALDAAGDLDAVVNNAALNGKGPLENYPLERIETVFQTNVFGALRVLQPLLPAWRDRGSGVVVNVSSIQGGVATPLDGPYAAAKYALEALTETLHYELAHFGIRVVILESGYTAPGMKMGSRVKGDPAYTELWEQWGNADEVVTGPDGRPGPEMVAKAIASAIEDPETPLRVPVGDDAAIILGARSSLGDAEFEATMRVVLGATW
jgi:NAD(P)-dependent dehydrogenase (short-subunit alcohol dehydrogenase family)